MKTSPEIAKLAEALSKAQLKFKKAELDGNNPHFGSRYATLSSVHEACRAALSEFGMAFTQIVESDGESTFLDTVLIHSSGEWISGRLRLIIDRQNMQGMGSAITYAKRYSLAAIVGVSDDEDDDGNGASKPQAGSPMRPRTTESKPLTPPQPNETPLALLNRLVRERGLAAEAKQYCIDSFRIDDATKLSAKQISETINFVNKCLPRITAPHDPNFDFGALP